MLVGGDVSGEGPVPRARATYVSADSTISADALGDGGKVVVFAEGFANVQGRLSARGGPHGGDGGFVETSGLGSFAIRHTPDTTAPGGEGGHWLIDPNDIEIVAGGGNVNINAADPFESTDDSAQLGIDLLVAALSGGQSVTVQTAESGANSQTGDITLSTPFDVESTTGTNTLTLDAHDDIEINRAITDAADGAQLNLVLDAGGDVNVKADITLRGGSLTTNGDLVIIANGAHVTVDGITWHMNAGFLDIGASDGAGGTVTVQNDGAIDATGHEIRATGFGAGVGTLNVETSAEVKAHRVLIFGRNKGSSGTVKVTGSGSKLTTVGADNTISVGDLEAGTLEVFDGGLVETYSLFLGVETRGSAVGRATVSGVASDGTRSRVIVSPDHGKSSQFPNQGGFVQVGGDADSRGTLEILDGGLFRVRDGQDTHGPSLVVARDQGSTGTLSIDGSGSSLEVIQDSPAVSGNANVSPGPDVWLGRRGGGTTTIRNGGKLLVRGEQASVRISNSPGRDPIDQQSVVNILSGGAMEVDGAGAIFEISSANSAGNGMVTVSGSGSRLTTKGTDNYIYVGLVGNGTLEVLDGGLVETLILDVGSTHIGIGRATISGVASDGTRSQVIVSPANGKFSGAIGAVVDQGGLVLVGLDAGGQGTLEILEGGLLQVRDGQGTHGPSLVVAYSKGSTGTLLIDGSGSSLEVIQDSPAVSGNANVSPGPLVWLGRRGGGTTTIRNGGRLLVQGEQAFVGISDSLASGPGATDQQSVVNLRSRGRLEADGEGAWLMMGDGGPTADGAVTVTGSDSTLITTGSGNGITVGDEGTGALTIGSGSSVKAARVIVGRRPGSQGTLVVESGGELEAGMLLAVGKDFDTDTLATQEPGGTGSAMGEAGSRARYDALEVGAGGSTNLEPPSEEVPPEEVSSEEPPSQELPSEEVPSEEPPPEEVPPEEVPPEEVPPEEVSSEEPPPEEPPPEEPPPEEPPPELSSEVQEDVDENTNAILSASPDDEEDRARQEDEQDEGDGEEEEEKASEETAAGESGEDEREELPMCPA